MRWNLSQAGTAVARLAAVVLAGVLGAPAWASRVGLVVAGTTPTNTKANDLHIRFESAVTLKKIVRVERIVDDRTGKIIEREVDITPGLLGIPLPGLNPGNETSKMDLLRRAS